MKKVVNVNNPDVYIIANDVYVNGDRIVCDTINDNFDLDKKSWRIVEYGELSMFRMVALMKSKFQEVPNEFWDELGVKDTDNVAISIHKCDETEKRLP